MRKQKTLGEFLCGVRECQNGSRQTDGEKQQKDIDGSKSAAPNT